MLEPNPPATVTQVSFSLSFFCAEGFLFRPHTPGAHAAHRRRDRGTGAQGDAEARVHAGRRQHSSVSRFFDCFLVLCSRFYVQAPTTLPAARAGSSTTDTPVARGRSTTDTPAARGRSATAT